MSLFGIQNDQVAENYYDFSPAQFQSYETEVVPKLHCTFIFDRKQNKAITRKLSKANIIKLSKAYIIGSVAEPPLFWAAPAPAPGRQGPGADSGSGSRQKKAAPGGSGSIH